MATMHQWQVLSRPDCSLCDAMLLELIALAGESIAARIQLVDISDDQELERRYGRRIPVLLIDGEFVCDYRLDAERVKPYLGDI